jgi:hypothetical protein
MPPAPREHLPVDPERRELVGGQVHPPPVEVLRHVAQEVGQLERLAERRRSRGGLRRFAHGAQHGQQLQADDLGRAVDVLLQRGPCRVVGDAEVHAHRAQEGGEQAAVDAEPDGGVDDRREHRIVGPAGAQAGVEGLGEMVEGGEEVTGCRARGGLVDDVVGVAGEAVQGVDRGSPGGRQQAGRQEERAAVLGVENPAPGVGVPE